MSQDMKALFAELDALVEEIREARATVHERKIQSQLNRRLASAEPTREDQRARLQECQRMEDEAMSLLAQVQVLESRASDIRTRLAESSS